MSSQSVCTVRDALDALRGLVKFCEHPYTAHGAWDAPVSVLRAQLKEKLEFIHSSVTSFDKAGKGVDPMKRSQCLQLHKDRELLVSQVTVVSACVKTTEKVLNMLKSAHAVATEAGVAFDALQSVLTPLGHALLDIGEHINVTCIPQDTAFVIYLDTATFFAELEFDVASGAVSKVSFMYTVGGDGRYSAEVNADLKEVLESKDAGRVRGVFKTQVDRDALQLQNSDMDLWALDIALLEELTAHSSGQFGGLKVQRTAQGVCLLRDYAPFPSPSSFSGVDGVPTSKPSTNTASSSLQRLYSPSHLSSVALSGRIMLHISPVDTHRCCSIAIDPPIVLSLAQYASMCGEPPVNGGSGGSSSTDSTGVSSSHTLLAALLPHATLISDGSGFQMHSVCTVADSALTTYHHVRFVHSPSQPNFGASPALCVRTIPMIPPGPDRLTRLDSLARVIHRTVLYNRIVSSCAQYMDAVYGAVTLGVPVVVSSASLRLDAPYSLLFCLDLAVPTNDDDGSGSGDVTTPVPLHCRLLGHVTVSDDVSPVAVAHIRQAKEHSGPTPPDPFLHWNSEWDGGTLPAWWTHDAGNTPLCLDLSIPRLFHTLATTWPRSASVSMLTALSTNVSEDNNDSDAEEPSRKRKRE